MKNVLLVGPVDTAGCWGDACRSYVKSLGEICNLNAQNLSLNGNKVVVGEDIAKYINNRQDHYDAIVQIVFAQWFVDFPRFKKNIGITFCESLGGSAFEKSSNAGCLDTLVVSSEREASYWRSLGQKVVKIPPEIHPIECKDTTMRDEFGADNDTKIFYCISEHNPRKNLGCIIKAYLRAFSKDDNVKLVIKTDRDIKEEIRSIRSALRIRPTEEYPEIFTIHSKMSKMDIARLHAAGDVYVNSSRGEGFCIPAHEAAHYGNIVLVPENNGIDIGTTYESMEESCFVEKPPMKNYYNGDATWRRPSSLALSELMKSKSLVPASPENLDVKSMLLELIND